MSQNYGPSFRFGVERDIDLSSKQFPTTEQLTTSEAPLDELNCQHGWFQSSNDDLQLHYRKFVPLNDDKPPRAIVIFMHGLQSHGGMAYTLNGNRRVNVALLAHSYMQQGFAMYCFDLRGHGYSEGKRHVLGKAEWIIQDYIKFIQLVVSFHPNDMPVFLAGESLGGNLTLQVAKYYQNYPDERPPGLRGLVLFSPAIYPTTIYTPLQLALQCCVTPFVPTQTRPPSWITSPIGPKNIWRDPERIEVAKQPGNVAEHTKHPPFVTLLTLVVLMQQVRDMISSLQIPFCVVHGCRDKAIPLQGSKFLMKKSLTADDDKACKFYPDALHDLLSEPERLDVMEFTVKWMNDRLAKLDNKTERTREK